MHSIRFKITAVTLAAILTSIVLLGGIGILAVGVESDRSSAERMQLISDNVRGQLDSYLNSLQQSVDMAIHIAEDSLEGLDPALLRAPGRTPEQTALLNDALTEHCTHVEHAFSSISNSTSGIVTYYYCIDASLGSENRGFFFSRLGEETFKLQPPLLSEELDPEDTAHTTWYYSPIAAGRPLWIGPYLAHYLGEAWTVSYVAPITCGGELVGVLGMDILFDTMTELVSDWKIYDTGFVSLLDADGRVLYHPELEIGSMPLLPGEGPDFAFFQEPDSGGELIRYMANSEERQMAFSTLSNGMKVVVTAPVREITAFRLQMTTLLIIATAVLLVVFGAIAFVAVESVTGPLRELTEAARELADGNYSAELPQTGKDEVGELTESFRMMRDQLKTHISDLNSRAYSDALTGVKNKGALDVYTEQLDEAIRAGGENGAPEFAFVMLDCNRLKQINDAHGHNCGDIYLKTACKTICVVFEHSPVFRIGGDEFTVLLRDRDYADRERLLRAFDEKAAERSAAARNPWEAVNLSRGMSEFRPGEDRNARQVLRRADKLMYEDKRHYKETHGADPGT